MWKMLAVVEDVGRDALGYLQDPAQRFWREHRRPAQRRVAQMSIYTSIWDSGTLREKVTLQLRLRARESQLKCNVWRLCERCFLFQGWPPGFDAVIGNTFGTVLYGLDCELVEYSEDAGRDAVSEARKMS